MGLYVRMASLVTEKMGEALPVEPPEPVNPVRAQVNQLLEAKRAEKGQVSTEAQASVQRLQAMVKSHKSVSPSQDAMG